MTTITITTPPRTFQPSRQVSRQTGKHSQRLSFSRSASSASSSSSSSSFLSNSNATTLGAGRGGDFLKPPPVAFLGGNQQHRRTSSRISSKRVKLINPGGGGGGKNRESRWEHGSITKSSSSLPTPSSNLDSLPLLDLNNASSLLSTHPLLNVDSSIHLHKRSVSLAGSPPPRSIPSNNSLPLSSLGSSIGSSRRHSKLGMLKHRQKLSNTQPVGGGGGEQHPRSPSIDITSVFNQVPNESRGEGTRGGGGGGQDAERLFEEAFPMYPSTSTLTDEEKLASPLMKLLSSPSSLPSTVPRTSTSSSPTTTLEHSLPTATAQVQGDSKSEVRAKKRESGGGGLRELELVKRRLSWESITGIDGSGETRKIEESSMMSDGEGEGLADEEKFEDALEEEIISPIMLPTILSTPPTRKRFLVSSSSRSTTLPLETSATLSLGLGLGIDLSSPPPSMLSPESANRKISNGGERLQGPIEFDELKEVEGLTGLGLGLGLGPALGMSEEGGGLRGLGLGFAELESEVKGLGRRDEDDGMSETMNEVMGEEKETEDSTYEDPPTPLLPSSLPLLSTTSPSTPPAPQAPQLHSKSTSPVKLVSPKRQLLPRSPPRAKKVSLLKLPGLSLKMRNQQSGLASMMGSKLLQGGQSKRVYPRGATGGGANGLSGLGLKEIGKKVAKQQNSKSAAPPPASSSSPATEEMYYGSPNLSDLPGSFLASPVLPTSFSDFSHSPLSPTPTPTPTAARFARMRRGGNQPQTAPLPDYSVTANWDRSISPLLPTTTPASASTSTYCPPSSTLEPPVSVPATPTLGPGTPTLSASPSFNSDVSAPSTPIPDQQVVQQPSDTAATAAAAAAAGKGGGEMNQQLFDAAIASTILGAIVCIGAVSWLAISVFKKTNQKGSSSKKGYYSGRGIGSDDHKSRRFSDEDSASTLEDEKYRASPASTPGGGGGGGQRPRISAPILTDLPKPPPMARLSFPPGQGTGGPVEGGGTPERSFSSHFDAWVDASTRRALQGASTEDHGGYPEEAVRGDGMSTNERRMSRASRHSVQSFAGVGRSYMRNSQIGNRSSYRSSTGPSIVDSTWSSTGNRPGTAYSSRTSHHDPSNKDYDLAPRLPSPISRLSVDTSDVAAYFATPPDTPTKSLRSYFTEVEPPVPSLPEDYRDLPTSTSIVKTRQRATSKSNGSKSTTSSSSKNIATLKSNHAMKTMPALSSIITSDEGHESPTEAALRKLEKRRATVDGGILADGLQALLFQAQLDSPTKGITDSNTEEKPDIFSTSTGGNGSAQIKRNSITSNGLSLSITSSSASSKGNGKSPKKSRPQTMPHLPPTIVVSSDQPAPPTPSSRQRTRTRTRTADSSEAHQQHQTDARASIKTYEQNLPWLAHSPSSNFSVHPRDDAGSVIDPEMRSIRHFSVDTNRFSVDSMPPPPKRFSQDFASFAAGRASQHAPLDSLDIASRRLASEDDLASQGGDGGNDTDQEEARRTQRRKTLLYSVYKQRGVDLSPTSASTSTVPAPPSPASPAPPTPSSMTTKGTSPGSLNTLSRTSLSDESNADTPTKGAARDLLVNSFPSPPPLPEAPAFASLVANLESTMDAAASLAGDDQSTPTPPTPGRSVSSTSVKATGRTRSETTIAGKENDIGTAQYMLHDKFRAPPTPPTAAFAPPARPPKSPIRMSIVPDSTSSTSPSSRIPLPNRQSVRQPFAPVNGGVNSIRGPAAPPPPPQTSTAVSKPTTVISPPVRSFAAELQDSVGNPAEGYDSDTLMSGFTFNNRHHGPGRSFFDNSRDKSGMMSNSSSGYGFASGMYSTNPASLESMEEVVAISHAETVQFGRSRASGIPQFSWRRNTGVAASGIGQYDSEESAYEESDAETAMFRARMDPIAE